MEILIEKIDNKVTQLEISGRLDAGTAGQLEKTVLELINEGEHQLIFNFANLVYISSAGLRILITTMKLLKTKQGLLVLCELQPMILDVLNISGFTRIFNIQATKDDAFLQF